MPSLLKLLQSYDIDLLTRIARLWNYEDIVRNREQVEEWLSKTLCDNLLVQEMVTTLQEPARNAFAFLKSNHGRNPWSEFILHFGELRSLGPAARERTEPDLHPLNVTEELFYRGLIGRAFFDTQPEPREFAFIPDEIFGNKATAATTGEQLTVRPVSQSEIKRHQPANTRLLDHMTDWLSCLRMKRALPTDYFTKADISGKFIKAIALTAGLITTKDEIQTEAAGKFLQSGRLTTLKEWFMLWKESAVFNDLRMVPGLEFEGTWQNDVLFARKFILQKIAGFDLQTWYSIASLVSLIETTAADFQRPAGNFDTWSIRKAGSTAFLTGRDRWDDVDGAYIRYLVSGPLHWLGVLDIAYGALDSVPTAFRLSPLAQYLLQEDAPKPALAAEIAPKLAPDLTIVVPVNSSRLVRYQVGRFTRISNNSVTDTRYQVTAATLTEAESFNLTVDQLIALLEKNIKAAIPESFKKLAQRWDRNHLEASFEKSDLLRVEDPAILTLLSEHPRADRMIKELLTPRIALMHSGGVEIARKVLLEAGVLSQSDLDV